MTPALPVGAEVRVVGVLGIALDGDLGAGRRGMASRMRHSVSGCRRDGVPPPKKTEVAGARLPAPMARCTSRTQASA